MTLISFLRIEPFHGGESHSSDYLLRGGFLYYYYCLHSVALVLARGARVVGLAGKYRHGMNDSDR